MKTRKPHHFWSCNVTTSTRQPTTRAWSSANIWRQDGATCSKNRKIVSFSTCTNPMIHLFYPPKFCINIVRNFSWDMKMSWRKSKTMPMQIFWGVEAMYYGLVQVEIYIMGPCASQDLRSPSPIGPTRPWSMLLAIFTMRKELHGFLFLSMRVILFLWLWSSAQWPGGPPEHRY